MRNTPLLKRVVARSRDRATDLTEGLPCPILASRIPGDLRSNWVARSGDRATTRSPTDTTRSPSPTSSLKSVAPPDKIQDIRGGRWQDRPEWDGLEGDHYECVSNVVRGSSPRFRSGGFSAGRASQRSGENLGEALQGTRGGRAQDFSGDVGKLPRGSSRLGRHLVSLVPALVGSRTAAEQATAGSGRRLQGASRP